MKWQLWRRKVVITKKSNNRSIVGILWSRCFGVWVLKSVQIENSQGTLVPADGEVIVLRENIDHVQRLP